MQKAAVTQELLEAIPFWDKLGDEERLHVKNAAFVRRFAAGELVQSAGGCSGAIQIISGALRASVISEEGREITLFRVLAGELCVMSASCVITQIDFDTQIEAEEETVGLVIPASTFGQLTESNIYARCYLYELMTDRFSQVMWVMQEMLFRRFDQRLAAFLVAECQRMGSRELHMTQAYIAQQVNSAREVVARMLKQFAADGLVESERGLIVVKNLPALLKLAR